MRITEYLAQHERKDLLRFLTCGSVDDGKSTLIGRLLYETKTVYEDQLEAVRKDSLVHGTTASDFDPALLTDGLKAEREQGITIDVAYRYFSTDRRKFIIADTPGHEQYTRNMATGASTCSLAVVLVDARHGVLTQTKRHSFIASLLGIRHVLVAVNKMDLMDWSEEVFERIRTDYNAFIARLGFSDVHFIPMSALLGDNVVEAGSHMPWYRGPAFLHHLESINLASERNLVDLRFPVQYVIRPDGHFRGYAGSVASGVLRVGDEVVCLPSRRTSRVRSIESFEGPLQEIYPPLGGVVTLEDDVDVSRGSMLAHPNNMPHEGHDLEAMLVWMDEAPAAPGTTYWVKQTTRLLPGTLDHIRYRVDVNTMRKADGGALEMNEIGRVRVTLHRPITYDPYPRNRQTGSFILIDRLTHATVAAGMIVDRAVSRPPPPARHIVRERSLVSRREREERLGQRGATVWLTGLSGSGKSTIARALERRLMSEGRLCCVLDGDTVRHGLNEDLGFAAEDRRENVRRVARVAELFNDTGLLVVAALISPYLDDRQRAGAIIGTARFIEVYVNTPAEECERRDPKQLYAKARAGRIPRFTGVSDAYEPPVAPDLALDTSRLALEACVDRIWELLRGRGFLEAGRAAEEQTDA